MRRALFSLLGSSNQNLDAIAKYYFRQPSKQLRPLIVLLFAKATNGLGQGWSQKLSESAIDLDQPLSRADVLTDYNPSISTKTAPFSLEWDPQNCIQSELLPPDADLMESTDILPTQRRLAQIVEMIHAASLLHDDVIDQSPLRRGAASAPEAYGTKLSVLGGNFILGRASAALARLGDSEVVELIASIMSNLVEGEILQMQEAPAPNLAWRVYLQKTYMKTASLMAKGARGAVVLGGCQEGQIYGEVAYAYGRNLGIAFQVSELPKGYIMLMDFYHSLWMTFWTMKREKQRWGNPGARTCNWGSRRVLRCSHGKNIPKLVLSLIESSRNREMLRGSVSISLLNQFSSSSYVRHANSFVGHRALSGLEILHLLMQIKPKRF